MKIEKNLDIEIAIHYLKKVIYKENIKNRNEILLVARELLTNILKHGEKGFFDFELEENTLKIKATTDVPYNGYIENYTPGKSTAGTLGYGLEVVSKVANSIKPIEQEKDYHTVLVQIKIERKEKRYQYASKIIPAVGELESGDFVFIKEKEDSIFFVIGDVLGHGKEAAKIVKEVKKYLEKNRNLDTTLVVKSLNENLKDKRGFVGLVGVAKKDYIEVILVGNITAYIHSKEKNKLIFSYSGVIGRLNKIPKPTKYSFSVGSILVAFSDGVERVSILKELEKFENKKNLKFIAEHLVRKYKVQTDDSSILLIRRQK